MSSSLLLLLLFLLFLLCLIITIITLSVGVVAGVNAIHASHCGTCGARESSLWLSALEMTPDATSATKAAQAYIQKYDHKQAFRSKEVQEFATQLQSSYMKLREAIKSETDLSDDVLQDFMEIAVLMSLK